MDKRMVLVAIMAVSVQCSDISGATKTVNFKNLLPASLTFEQILFDQQVLGDALEDEDCLTNGILYLAEAVNVSLKCS